jgi:hypothetical protein
LLRRLTSTGGAWEIVAEFVEVESGKRADRFGFGSHLDAWIGWGC